MGSIRRSKTKRRTRDLDQIHGDLRNPRQLLQLKALIPDEDRPALGIYHCVECAKYFEQEHNLREHRRGKNHKRRYLSLSDLRYQISDGGRVRMLKEEPYSQKEADAAAGIGCASFYEAREQKRVDEEEEERKMEIEA